MYCFIFELTVKKGIMFEKLTVKKGIIFEKLTVKMKQFYIIES